MGENQKERGLPGETESSVKAKLRRGTFTATDAAPWDALSLK